MGDAGRYRRAYPRIWRHPGFQKLTQAQQRVALYLLTGPQTNRIGAFYFSVATASEDLGLGVDTLREALRVVTVSFGWLFDADAKVVYIPTWWRWNRPDHAKVLQGNLKDLSELPPCALVDAFTSNLAYLTPELHESFIEACRIRLPKASPSQDQEAGSGKQDQEQEQTRARAARGIGTESEHPKSGLIPDELKKFALQASEHVAWDANADLLIDTFRQFSKKGTRSEVLQAMRAALRNGRTV